MVPALFRVHVRPISGHFWQILDEDVVIEQKRFDVTGSILLEFHTSFLTRLPSHAMLPGCYLPSYNSSVSLASCNARYCCLLIGGVLVAKTSLALAAALASRSITVMAIALAGLITACT